MSRKRLINTGLQEGKFFSGDDVNLNIEIGRNYLATDMPATILLFRIDRLKTKVNNLYGETRAREKVTLAPIELQVRMVIEQNDTDYLGDTNIVKHYAGQLVFTVYDKELKENQVDITRGDYIGFRNSKQSLTYYVVNDADVNNVSNSKTIGGLGMFYRKITAIPVDKDVFQG